MAKQKRQSVSYEDTKMSETKRQALIDEADFERATAINIEAKAMREISKTILNEKEE